MNQEFPASFQIRTGMQDSPTGIKKKFAFIRDFHPHNILFLNPLLDHIGKMMDIDYSFTDSGSLELAGHMFDKRYSTDRNQGLRHHICQRFQTGTQTRSEYQAFHNIRSTFCSR